MVCRAGSLNGRRDTVSVQKEERHQQLAIARQQHGCTALISRVLFETLVEKDPAADPCDRLCKKQFKLNNLMTRIFHGWRRWLRRARQTSDLGGDPFAYERPVDLGTSGEFGSAGSEGGIINLWRPFAHRRRLGRERGCADQSKCFRFDYRVSLGNPPAESYGLRAVRSHGRRDGGRHHEQKSASGQRGPIPSTTGTACASRSPFASLLARPMTPTAARSEHGFAAQR